MDPHAGGRLNDSSNSWAMPAFSHPLAMWRLPISLLRWLYRSTNHEEWRGSGEDDYSDAEEELEANLDTD